MRPAGSGENLVLGGCLSTVLEPACEKALDAQRAVWYLTV